MKKHIIGIIVLILIIALLGVSIWFIVRRNNSKPLYGAACSFAFNKETDTLTNRILQAENLYQTKVSSSEARLTTLNSVIKQLDNFEKDLTSYLQLSSKTSSTTSNLSKSYTNLSAKRSLLITDYDEYITRMNGNIDISGSAVRDLYTSIFNKTVDYVYEYTSVFESTSNYAFGTVYKVATIKNEMYKFYSSGVKNLLNNISNNQFKTAATINRLNNGIKLINNNIAIKSSVTGGEFNSDALLFKKYFNNSNLDTLISNFEEYYAETIDITIETSNEKLAVYYAKLIIEV